MSKGLVIVHKGLAFASQGLGRFAKDIVHVGRWIHPVTKQEVVFDKARIQRLVDNSNRYLSNGNRIPFPDGHSNDAMKNLGDWPGPFISHGDDLVGVVEPKAAGIAAKLQDGSIDSVSAFIDTDVVDSKGNKYDEVLVHVCATPYPVITEQKGFLKLSQDVPAGSQLFLAQDLVKKQDDVAGEDKAQPAIDRLTAAILQTSATRSRAEISSVELAAVFRETAKKPT